MPTKRPLSTISYNTEPFLVATLEELIKARVLSFYAYIGHDPEPDESHDDSPPGKSHFHVYMEPNRSVDPAELRARFSEPDLQHPGRKALGCMKIRFSDFPDWYLYGLHDEGYLASKGQARIHHYLDENFHYSDEDDWYNEVSQVDRLALVPATAKIKSYIQAGKTFHDMVADGLVPVNLIGQFEKAFDILANGPRFTRNGRPGHDAIIDTKTGELTEKPLPRAKYGQVQGVTVQEATPEEVADYLDTL